MSRCLALSLLCIACATTAPAARSSEASSDASVEELVKEGTQLHDQGAFDAAIAKYREALARDPGNPLASYELAYSLSAKGDHRAAIEAARGGLGRPWKGAGGLHMLIGSALDDLGEPEKALAAYREGLDQYPDFAMLHFNLGVAYARVGANAKAIACMKNSVSLSPAHPGSHFLLGKLFLAEGHRVPGVFALARFLMLEGTTARSAEATELIERAFASGVRKKDDKTVEIVLSPRSKSGEGDFMTVDLAMSTHQATAGLPEHKDQRPAPVQRLDLVLKVYGELKAHGSGWSERYYGAYFSSLGEAGLTEAYSYAAMRGDSTPGISTWLKGHEDELEKLVHWSELFTWPDARVPLDEPARL